MNIIIIDNNYRKGDDRTRINFIKKLAYFKDIKLHLLRMPLSKIVQEKIYSLKPDVFLFLMHNSEIRKLWPDFLFNSGVATVVLEEDHYESKFDGLVYSDKTILDWYKDKQISLLIRRHCYEEKAPVESVWLPFSANEEEFDRRELVNITNRKHIVGFAGSYTSTQVYYDVRRKAIQILKDAGLLDETYGKIYNGYAEYLKNHVVGLACTGGILHTPLAKTFEIPLSGSALLTNKMDHANLLWGENKCYFEYKDDCSDIVEVAKHALLDHDEVSHNGWMQVFQHHTDYHRIRELYHILKALVEGKNIPRKWSQ